MDDIEIVPGVWLVHAHWAGEGRWFWQCRKCHSFGPLDNRLGAEFGARVHRHRVDPATKPGAPGVPGAQRGDSDAQAEFIRLIEDQWTDPLTLTAFAGWVHDELVARPDLLVRLLNTQARER